jgi:hypothetical protein
MEQARPDKGREQVVVWDEAKVEVVWAVRSLPVPAAIVSVPVADIGRRMQRASRAIAEAVRRAAAL